MNSNGQNAPKDLNHTSAMLGIAPSEGIDISLIDSNRPAGLAPVQLDITKPIYDQVNKVITYPIYVTSTNPTSPFSGAVTIADGADVAEGHTTDSAWSGSGASTVIGLLKGLFGHLALESGGNLATIVTQLISVIANTNTIVTNTDTIITNTNAIGVRTDPSYTGSGGSTTEIALLRALYDYLSSVIAIKRSLPLSIEFIAINQAAGHTTTITCDAIAALSLNINVISLVDASDILFTLERIFPTYTEQLLQFSAIHSSGKLALSIGQGLQYSYDLGHQIQISWSLITTGLNPSWNGSINLDGTS